MSKKIVPLSSAACGRAVVEHRPRRERGGEVVCRGAGFSSLAERLFDSEGLHILPGHALGEIGHVLIERYRKREVTQEQFDLARSVLPGSFVLVSLDEIFERAVEIALAINQTLYDALYIAAAERWDTVVVTADHKLARSVLGTSWAEKVVRLENWEAKPRT